MVHFLDNPKREPPFEQHTDGLTRFPPNIEEVSVSGWLTDDIQLYVRRNDVILSLSL